MRRAGFSMVLALLLLGIVLTTAHKMVLAQVGFPAELVFWQDADTGQVTPAMQTVTYMGDPDQHNTIQWVTSVDAPWVYYTPEFGKSQLGAVATVSITGTAGYPSGTYEGLFGMNCLLFDQWGTVQPLYYRLPVRLIVVSQRIYLPTVLR